MISIRGSIVDANSYLTKEDALSYITSHAMYTPLNMDKETGAKKKLEFTINVLSESEDLSILSSGLTKTSIISSLILKELCPNQEISIFT